MITSTPWYVDEEGVFVMAEIPGYGDDPILEIRGWGRLTNFHGLSEEESTLEQKRVGALAAAAPDLLEAAEKLLKLHHRAFEGDVVENVQWDTCVSVLRMAVEKARIHGVDS